jgi:hypothetical protein
MVLALYAVAARRRAKPSCGIAIDSVYGSRGLFLELVSLTRLHSFFKSGIFTFQSCDGLVFELQRVLKIRDHSLFSLL